MGPNGKRDLAQHLKKGHEVKQVVCQFCSGDYKTPFNLRRHQNTCRAKKNQMSWIPNYLFTICIANHEWNM